MLNIAISGANGFVGRKLSDLLLSNPEITVVKVGRNNADNFDNFINIETDDALIISQRLKDFDCFIHLAARAHTNNSTPEDFQRDNVNLSSKLAQIAKDAGIKQFIYLSSIKVLGNTTLPGKAFTAADIPAPADLYGKSKLASEIAIKEILNNSTIGVTIIRPPLVWGNECKGNLGMLVNLINKSIPIPFGSIHNRRDIVSLENLCGFISHTLLNPDAANKTFLVSDGEVRNTKEIVELLEKFAHKKAFFISVPNVIFRLLKHLPFWAPRVESFFDNLEVDITETENLLHWKPIK